MLCTCSSLRETHHECERRTLCRHQQVSQWGCLLQFYPENILGVYNISTISHKIRSEKVLEPRKCNCWVESRWRAWPDNHWTRRRGVLSCRSCQPERRWRLRRGAPLPDCSCAENQTTALQLLLLVKTTNAYGKPKYLSLPSLDLWRHQFMLQFLLLPNSGTLRLKWQ